MATVIFVFPYMECIIILIISIMFYLCSSAYDKDR